MVVGQMVNGTTRLARTVAGTVVGVGDGVMGGVVGGVAGAVQGASEGLGVRGAVSPSAAVVTAGVAAGVLGLVDWPLLALAGGTALLMRQLSGTSAGARRRPTANRVGAPAAVQATITAQAPSAAANGRGARKVARASASSTAGGAKKSTPRRPRATAKRGAQPVRGS